MLRKVLFGLTAPVAAWAWLTALGCGGQSDAAPASGVDGGGPRVTSPSQPLPPPSHPALGDASPGQAPAAPPATLASVNKIDLLFDIDNSASMGDKQAYLTRAIPDLVTRLVTPNCVDAAGNVLAVANVNGSCTTGTVEFPPVHDMHIGIVTSSLGSRLGNVCDPSSMQSTTNGTVSRHNDDQGRLINRASDPNNLSNYTESALADLGTANFLDWFPKVAANGAGTPGAGAPPIGDSAELLTDFQSVMSGVHPFGCGIESQLESWYRFLIQPDPYGSLALDASGRFAQWVGVDTTILAQRADFLRPDSLVAVIVLSDENDSEVDVRSFGGTAWNFMSSMFRPPRGTSVCLTAPNDPGCTSCAFGKSASDPQCVAGGGTYSAATDWGFDLNLRHVHEQQKYGVSVQFPIQRYLLGLTSPKVPDRSAEYPAGAANYQGLGGLGCTNPLFAAKLPAPPANVDPSQWQPTADELCNLQPGSRTARFVYYLHIGGVPHQLLQRSPSDPDSPQKTALAAADWQLILGKDPLHDDYTGIDPHMVESYQTRVGTQVPDGGFPVSPSISPEGTDPISGREWVTDSTAPQHQSLPVDREYACIFPLAAPRRCDDASINADPTLVDSCDCQPPSKVTGGAFTHDQVPAVCNDATPTQQDYAKAYPTIRELLLAKLLGDVPGANQGIVSSICPIHTIEAAAGDPLYGYRPAMSAIIDRLKGPSL